MCSIVANLVVYFSHSLDTCFTLSQKVLSVFCFFLLFSSTTSSLAQTLHLRSSLELRLANHQAMAIVFQLEYVFSAPIGQEMMVRSRDWGENLILVLNAGSRLNSFPWQPKMSFKVALLLWNPKAQNTIDVERHAHMHAYTETHTLLSSPHPAFVLSPPGSYPRTIIPSISCQGLPEEITKGILG